MDMNSLKIENFETLNSINTKLKNALTTLVKHFPIDYPSAELNTEYRYDKLDNRIYQDIVIEINGYFTVSSLHEYHKLVNELVKCFHVVFDKRLTTTFFKKPAIVLKYSKQFKTHKFKLYFKIEIQNQQPEEMLSKLFKCNVQKKVVEHHYTETVYSCATKR